MSKNEKITIIVPIYNSSNYLKECLLSLMAQSYKNLEILLINDGSTDDSAAICENFCRRDTRFRLINKSNGGVSSSRNKGINESTGKYIVFLDSDDYLDTQIIEKAYLKMQKDGSDVCLWNTLVIPNNKCKKIDISTKDINDVVGSLIGGISKHSFYGLYFRAVWGKMFSAEILKKNNLFFSENLYIGEDAVFLLYLFSKVKCSISYIDDIGYFYRIVSNSAVHRYKKDLLNQAIIQKNYIESQLLFYDNLDKSLINTAMIAFVFDVYSKLVINDMAKLENNSLFKIPEDTKKWIYLNKSVLSCKDIKFGLLAKSIKIQFLLNKVLPNMMLYYFTKYYKLFKKSWIIWINYFLK